MPLTQLVQEDKGEEQPGAKGKLMIIKLTLTIMLAN